MPKNLVIDQLQKTYGKPTKKKAFDCHIYDAILHRAEGLKTAPAHKLVQVAIDHVNKIKKQYANANYCLLDTETTGSDQFRDEVIELAIVDKDDNVVYDSLFQCVDEISAGAQEVHGISKDKLNSCNYLIEKIHEVRDVVSKYDFISIYNQNFDVNVINSTCYKQKESGISNYKQEIADLDNYIGLYPVHDVMHLLGGAVLLWDRKYMHWDWMKLEGGHRAAGDCQQLNKAIKMVLDIDDEVLENTYKAAQSLM